MVIVRCYRCGFKLVHVLCSFRAAMTGSRCCNKNFQESLKESRGRGTLEDYLCLFARHVELTRKISANTLSRFICAKRDNFENCAVLVHPVQVCVGDAPAEKCIMMLCQ